MPYFSRVPVGGTTQQVIDTFYGYNHNLKIGEGEFFEEKNLTSDYYPLLANRNPRKLVKTLDAPHGMLGKAQLTYIDGSRLYYGDTDLTSYLLGEGCKISEDESMLPKQLISMGAYIVIWPDKLYINTENYTDCGAIESTFETSAVVSYTLCNMDGTEYEAPTISSAEPTEPENGALWIDTSAAKHVLKQYSEMSGMWSEIATVYVKISSSGIGKGFAVYDGVTIAGCAAPETGMAEQVDELNGSKIIYAKDDDYIVVVGLLDQVYTQETGTVSVKRTMPDMDFITEAENRLWGCKYGLVNGETVNEIYACALGDFKNWNQFLGIATDSYAASVGTDGQWTGAVTYLGYPIFFKENGLHKVYISATGAHQITDTACRGVQKGSHNSLAVVNETLFYKSATDVCAYDGSLPASASAQMGSERYSDAVAGTIGDKYYISMQDQEQVWHLFVLDTGRGLWHREDNTQVLHFARCNGALYYINSANELTCTTGGDEERVEWSATTGLMGYRDVNKKSIRRFNLRMMLPKGSYMQIHIEYDSDGVWHDAGLIEGSGTKTFMLPVRPRRCDHFRIRMEGAGDVRLYSFAKIYRSGSDVG